MTNEDFTHETNKRSVEAVSAYKSIFSKDTRCYRCSKNNCARLEFPDTIYVKDKKKVLVDKWNLADDNSDVLIFDKKGKLIYKKFGKLSAKEIKNVLALIEKNL